MPTRRLVALHNAIFADGRDQQTIALKAGVDPAKLSHAIHGRRRLTPKDEKKLARELKRSVEDLFPPLPVKLPRLPAKAS